ncbi:MAG: alanine--tRNA ligase-related protein [Sphaerochaeta sp.]|jgi:Ser-tRNA(Ala) deacylase AlaX|nr:alanine--tRNA ligase-related protein [Sphaerochaeta sp.]
MIQTEAVYYQEPYRKELDAKVLAIDGNIVILDRTICYPEGGGQPGDRGNDRIVPSCRYPEDGRA